MKNFKIGTRIALGFALMIVITIILGLFAYNRTQNIQASKADLADNYLPSVALLSKLVTRANHQVSLLTQHTASSDPQEETKLEAQINELSTTNEKDFEAYEALPSSDEEKVMTANMKAARDAKVSLFNETFRVSRLNTKEGNAKAKLMLDEQVRPAEEKYTDAIQALVDYNMKGAQGGLVTIANSVSSSKQGILIGLVLSVIFAIPISIYIVRSITGPIQLAVATLERVEHCDLTATLDIDSKDEMGQMAKALNAALKKLRNTMKEVVANAATASASSQELSSATEAIASGAQEQAASLEETSASLEEITATIRQSADNAKQANQLANGSRESAERGQDVVTNAVAAMAEINVASAKISDIISTIDEIAFQTNLLAVNAAVEAARAGEEGRGFAVVASEVRSLAQRSAGAAKEIKVLIQDTLKKVERGSELVTRSGETLLSIVGSVKRVTDIVGEISAAADEQSTGVDQVNTAVTQIDQVTQSNAAQTEELSSTAQTLAAQSGRLTKLVSVFVLDTDQQDMVEAPVSVRSAMSAVGARTNLKKGVKKIVTKVSATPKLNVPAAVMASAGAGSDSSFEEF